MPEQALKTKPWCFFFLVAMITTLGCETPVEDLADATTTSEISTAVEAADDLESDQVVTVIEAGPTAAKAAQEALILAEPGDVIEFAAGTFEFDGTLSLDGTDNITIRGQGIEKTILDFSKQKKGSGGEGVRLKSNNFLMEDLTIQNSPGDAIKITDSDMVTFRRVRTWWSGGPAESNGSYGFYPVLCDNVLIEHCVAECASDAGIYVGQTKNTIVRYNRASQNVAGIEIENTIGADVYENECTGNTAGLLTFSLPGLTITNGKQARLYKNRVYDNNLANFAPKGAIVSKVPAGTGVMIMATNEVEVFDNDVHGNKTVNCAIVSFRDTDKRKAPEDFNRYPQGIHIHDNRFADGGTDPEGRYAELYKSVVADGPIPDILFDGLVNPDALVDGKLPDELGIRINNNGDATFVNLNMSKVLEGGEPEFSTDISEFAGKFEPLPAVTIPAPSS